LVLREEDPLLVLELLGILVLLVLKVTDKCLALLVVVVLVLPSVVVLVVQ
jgi:hypothetical protein